MKINTITLPDTRSLASELEFANGWDPPALSALIRSKCAHGESPAFLFLGRHEAGLLRGHLAAGFGEGSVPTLHKTYYMGLDVVEIDVDSFLHIGGRKRIATIQDPIARRSPWRDRDTASLWQLKLR
jgi:hypothetical protein